MALVADLAVGSSTSPGGSWRGDFSHFAVALKWMVPTDQIIWHMHMHSSVLFCTLLVIYCGKCLLLFIDKLIAHVILLMVNRTRSVKLTEVHLGEVLLLSWCGGRCHWAEYGRPSGGSRTSLDLDLPLGVGMFVAVAPNNYFASPVVDVRCWRMMTTGIQ